MADKKKTYTGDSCPECGGTIEAGDTEWVSGLTGVRQINCVGKCQSTFSEQIEVVALTDEDGETFPVE